MIAKQETVGYGTLVRGNPDFRNLWIGQIISLLGDWFNLIASASLVAALTDSELAVGALFVVRMLAPFAVTPIAGVAADRYNRKNLLIATDIIRAIAVLGFLYMGLLGLALALSAPMLLREVRVRQVPEPFRSLADHAWRTEHRLRIANAMIVLGVLIAWVVVFSITR